LILGIREIEDSAELIRYRFICLDDKWSFSEANA